MPAYRRVGKWENHPPKTAFVWQAWGVGRKACRRKERVIYGFELEEWGPLLGVAGQTDQRNEQESGHFAVSMFLQAGPR